MDTISDSNNVLEGGGSAANHLGTNTNQNSNYKFLADGAPEIDNEDELVLPPEVWASVMECKLLSIYCTYY